MYPPTDAVYFPLYTKCCELDLPLCMNTGIPGPPLPAEPQNPIHLDRVCYRFPELKLCMIHGADPWWDTAIRLMIKYRNLRLMTSAWSPKRLPASLLHYMSTRGKDRILFASDYPVLSMQRCLGEAAALDLTDEVRDAWLYDNAHAFFFGSSLSSLRTGDPARPTDGGPWLPRSAPSDLGRSRSRSPTSSASLIVSGELSEGDSLGHEPDLVERFGVSRPSLREALRILEAEGLITVVRGVRGGVVVHAPDERMTARTAALLLQARNVSLADVFEARSLLEPIAARGDRHGARPAGRGQGAARPRPATRKTPSRTRSGSVSPTRPSTNASCRSPATRR